MFVGRGLGGVYLRPHKHSQQQLDAFMLFPPTVLAVRVSRCRLHESSQDFKIPNFGGLASPTPPLPCHSRSVGEDCGWAVPKAGSKVALHAPPHHLCHSRSVGEECGWAAPKAARVVPPHAPPPDPCNFRSMGEECGTLRRADHLIVGSVAVGIETE